MKKSIFGPALLALAAFLGCTDGTSGSRDNSGVNVRDQKVSGKTPMDQNENKVDIGITAKIRQEVVDSDMSINAKNVKIITQDGQVTLRGPVNTPAEKDRIVVLATKVAGAGKVKNELEVKSTP